MKPTGGGDLTGSKTSKFTELWRARGLRLRGRGDHLPVQVKIETKTGERGKDRPLCDEQLVYEEKIQAEIIRILKESFTGRGTQITKWDIQRRDQLG